MQKQELLKEKPTPKLSPKHVFGIRTDLPNNIQFFTNDKCAYIAGSFVVFCATKGGSQNFFPSLEDYGGITCFGVDEVNDEILLALAQKAADKSCLFIRHISKVTWSIDTSKTQTIHYSGGDYLLALAVNSTKEFIAALSGPGTPALVVIYQLDSKGVPKTLSKINMTYQTPYQNISINVYHPYFISVWGDNGFSLILINEQDKKSYTKTEVIPSTFNDFSKYLFNIVSCAWISKTRVAFLNSTCDVFVLEFTNKMKLETPNRRVIKWTNIFDNQSKGKAIFSKNGNLYIAKDDGVIAKLEDHQTDKEIIYQKPSNTVKFVQNMPRMEIHHLTANKFIENIATYSAIIISTASAQIYILDISNDNAIYDGNNYKYLVCPFHSEEIVAMDIAKWKQLVVTCSRDRTIRVWNYFNLQMEASGTLDDDAYKVEFHPNGLHLAVLFRDKIKLMHILESTIVPYKDLLYGQPHDVKFSTSGSLLAICYKNAFEIINFYTCEKVHSSKALASSDGSFSTHTDEVTGLAWDIDDNGFATCSLDGKVIYWSLTSKDVVQLDYQSRDSRFTGVEIWTVEDHVMKRKTLFLLEDNGVFEISKILQNKEGQVLMSLPSSGNITMKTESVLNEKKKLEPKLLQKGKFSCIAFDQDLKLLFLASAKQSPSSIILLDYNKPYPLKDPLMFEANAMGILAMKASSDMTHLFTCGRDRCLFFFKVENVIKSNDKREIEIFEPESLILVQKDILDKNALELRKEISEKDAEIIREEENFENEARAYEADIDRHKEIFRMQEMKFSKEKSDLENRLRAKIEYYENELEKIRSEHSVKMEALRQEHEKNVEAKERDIQRESANLKNEIEKDSIQGRNILDRNLEEEKHLQENHKKQKDELKNEIARLQKQEGEILEEIEKEKRGLIDCNDNIISEKRKIIEKLKMTFLKNEQDHKKQEDELKAKIDIVKAENRKMEQKKSTENGELQTLKSENVKLEKQISDMQADRKEKEDTINDKNLLKRKLDKDNQELEKFKYVLHYKIKELKHNKEPKERKIQQMEAKAKEMEREIKACENSQASIILHLSSNHQTIKIHEKQIGDTEKRIEIQKNYKKLFQESVFTAMKRAKNHKDCKKELVTLKRLFIDQEFIQVVEKPFESNYELQRNFLENNVEQYTTKIQGIENLYAQDHAKVMKEQRQLIGIVNQLEKEKKEINLREKNKKVSSFAKPKLKNKIPVPKFDGLTRNKDYTDEIALKELMEELKELEMDVQWIKYWQKKKTEEKEKMEKHVKKNQEEEVSDLV